MNQSLPDEYEYEDADKQNASRNSQAALKIRKLRTRREVFNRPFAADSTSPPTYSEKSPLRRTMGFGDEAELVEGRSSHLKKTRIDYLDEDDFGQEETRPNKTIKKYPSRKITKPKPKNFLAKLGWAVIGLLVLRLIFMDRGVWDYFATESIIKDKQNELSFIRRENQELQAQISKIQLDKNFQKQLAKEHLGVIAADEFLILFAGESAEEETGLGRSL